MSIFLNKQAADVNSVNDVSPEDNNLEVVDGNVVCPSCKKSLNVDEIAIFCDEFSSIEDERVSIDLDVDATCSACDYTFKSIFYSELI